MMSRGLNLVIRFSSYRGLLQTVTRSSSSVSTDAYGSKDPAPYFFNEEVQKILHLITRAEPKKVFRRRLDARELEAPEYKFMTEEQLQKALRKAKEEMDELLQMPPVVKIREEDTRVLSKDPALQGHSTAKLVVTDITFGVKNKDRTIAVREPNGTLRVATNSERDRLNQIYFPIQGREIYMPKMFLQENLEPILDRGDYEFIMNRACIQFDPDNPDYHRVAQETYDHINNHMQFEKLRSTRHYGPMIFYFAWKKKIDNLLLENITTDRIEDAVSVTKLYYILNPSDNANGKEHVKLLQFYIETDCTIKRKLDHALKTYLELESAKKKLEENIAEAHGRTRENNT